MIMDNNGIQLAIIYEGFIAIRWVGLRENLQETALRSSALVDSWRCPAPNDA